MKGFLLIALMVVLVTGLVFGGCAQEAPAPAPAPEKVWELKFANQTTEVGLAAQYAVGPWSKSLEEASKGRIKVTPYYAQTLVKGYDAWTAVKTGLAEMGWCFHGYWPGMTPLAEVVTLPFLGIPTGKMGSTILWQLYEEFPEIQEEYADNKILILYTSDAYIVATTKKQIKTMEDLKGLKMRTTGGPPTEMVELLGAVPVLVAAPALYENLEKGVIDGVIYALPWAGTFRPHEVLKYYTYVPTTITTFSIPMNWDTWNSFPEDLQEAIWTGAPCGFEGSQFWGENFFDKISMQHDDLLISDGFPPINYTPPPEEVERWKEVAGEPIWDEWVEDKEAEGLPGQKILDATLRLITEYQD